MQRRQFIRNMSLGMGAMSFGGCACPSQRLNQARKPNIIYIMADDLGYRELGCYGQKKIQTPNLDRLCAEGMKFTDHYSGSAVCAPARCNLMTGKHGGNAFVRDNYEIGDWESHDGQLPLPEGTVTIASVMKKNGYVTGAFGKWGLGGVGSSGDPLKQGFDRFFGYNCQRHAHNLYPRYVIDDQEERMLPGNTRGLTGEHYGPQIIADEMLEWVRNNQERPFFLYYPTLLPHLPLQAPPAYVDIYKGRWPETPYEGPSYLPNPYPRATYAAMITFLDAQVGRLMELVKELGLDQDTVIMFTSDNGVTHLGPDQVDYAFFESAGELRGFKGSLHEGGIRVPMIARWPGKIKPGAVTDHISSHYDVLVTLCELAGINMPLNTDGKSFAPTLLSEYHEQEEHPFLFWDYAGYGGQLAVRMGKWKGIKKNLRNNPDSPLELYDLENDISEEINLVNKYPEISRRIEDIMLTARTKPSIERFTFGKYQEDL